MATRDWGKGRFAARNQTGRVGSQMKRMPARVFQVAFGKLGLSQKELGNLPTDFEDLYDASRIVIGLFEETEKQARRGRRGDVAKLLADIQVQVHTHITFPSAFTKEKARSSSRKMLRKPSKKIEAEVRCLGCE